MAIGNPVSTTSSSVASKTSSVIATAGQTLFTVLSGYVTNHISVFRNGIRLVDGRDYEARNGATVTLLAAATVGDVLEFHVFDTFSVADAVTNQGGTIFGDLTVEGSIGDITANNVTGVAATFTGAVSVGGVLTYEDVTNIDSVGIITARSDLSIADKIIHTGDTNTSIRFPAADTITAETGGSERLRITSGGNVGIGTDNPSSIFDVETGTGSGINFGSDGVNAPTLNFMAGSVRLESAAQILVGENSGGGDLLIKTKNTSGSLTTRVSVNKDGNFSLGNTTINLPSGTGLQVYDASAPRIKLANSTTGVGSGDGAYLYVSGNDFLIENKESANMRFYTAATERLRIDSSGRLLLGTTIEGEATADNLTIADSGHCGITLRSGTSSVGTIFFSDATSGADEYRGVIQYDHNGDYLKWVTAGAERMRITSAGKVGIGAISPSSLLTLRQTTASHQIFEISRPNSDSAALFIGNDSSNNALISANNADMLFGKEFAGTFTERMRIDNSGRLLLGTTTAYSSVDNLVIQTTDASGRIGLQHSTTGQVTVGEELGRISFYSNDGDLNPSASIIASADLDHAAGDKPGRITFNTTADGASSTTERMRINSLGDVGVGVSPSGVKLHLKGNYMRIDDVNQNLGTIFIGAENGVNTIYSQTANAAGGNHPLRFVLGGSAEAMRITSSGYMGLGTISPQHILHLHRPDSGTNYLQITNSTTGAGAADGCLVGVNADEDVILWQREANNIQFGTSNTERMRIDSAGKVYMGTIYDPVGPSAPRLHAKGTGGNAYAATVDTTGYTAYATSTVSGGYAMWIYNTSTSQQVGSIYVGHAAVTYNTTSDYRAKENVVDLTSAIPRLKTLPVHRFNFIADSETTVDGFLAHEAQNVVPEAVTGTKDEVDDDGNPVMQGIDQSKLVPLLTAALQEAITEIESLKARVTTLEG